MSIHRFILFPFALLVLAACSSSHSQTQSLTAKTNGVIQTFKRVERTFKVGADPTRYSALVADVDGAIAYLPEDTPPRVTELLKGSVDAYRLFLRYSQCDSQDPGSAQATCRDAQLEQIITKFPLIRRNITRRLMVRPNPPVHLSSVISQSNVLQLLLMQAELNRVDAHLILTGGRFDQIYSAEPEPTGTTM